MPVFVRASRRARSYTRGSRSKLAAHARMLGLPKATLVKSHAFRLAKDSKADRGQNYARYLHHTARLNKLERHLRSIGIDPHGRR